MSINGGAGFDTVIAIGTEEADAFVITDEGIFGAGLNIRVDGVEEAIEVDGLEGDDTFFLLSTRAQVLTTVIGGLGSDTFVMTGDVTKRVVSADLEGRAGVINHGVESGDAAYDGLLVEGIGLNVSDAKSGAVVITPTSGDTVVAEGGFADEYDVSMAELWADLTSVPVAYITVSAAKSSASDKDGLECGWRGVRSVDQRHRLVRRRRADV